MRAGRRSGAIFLMNFTDVPREQRAGD